jgi:hypothetical protein
MRASRWQLWAAILGGWIVLSLFDASSMFLSYGYGPQPLPFAQTLLFAWWHAAYRSSVGTACADF